MKFAPHSIQQARQGSGCSKQEDAANAAKARYSCTHSHRDLPPAAFRPFTTLVSSSKSIVLASHAQQHQASPALRNPRPEAATTHLAIQLAPRLPVRLEALVTAFVSVANMLDSLLECIIQHGIMLCCCCHLGGLSSILYVLYWKFFFFSLKSLRKRGSGYDVLMRACLRCHGCRLSSLRWR